MAGELSAIDAIPAPFDVPADWTTPQLSLHCEFVRDGDWIESKDQGGNDYRLLQISNIGVGRFVETGNFRCITEDTFKRLNCTEILAGDVLVARMPDPTGRAWYANDLPWRAVTAVDIAIVRTKPNELDPRFLSYFLNSPQCLALVHRLTTGTTRLRIRRADIERLCVPRPPILEQRSIARILGTLDDKIELNRRMNETLEAIARAVFKSWFVDFDPVRAKAAGRDPSLPQPLADLFPDSFENSEVGEIPTGWEVGPLGRFFAIGLGGAWGEEEESDRARVRVRCLRGIDCHELAEGRVPGVPVRWVSPKQASDRRLSDGVVLIEGSGSFCGRSMIWKQAYGQLLGEPIAYSNFCKRLDPICSASQAVVCWMQVRQAYREGLLQSFRTGTAFPNFDVHGMLENLIVVVPPGSLADAYARVFESSQRLDLMAQSRTLAVLRDSLLPKLISGELRVEEPAPFIGTKPA